MDKKVLYHKKFDKVEVTISKTTWKEKLEALLGIGLIAFIIWWLANG